MSYPNRMRDTAYGPYGYQDPYGDHHDGPAAVVEHVMQGMTYVDGVALAENPAWQQACDPNTGEPLYYSDGTPVVYQVPMEQRMAPIVRRRMRKAQWIRNVLLCVPIAFVVYMVVVLSSSPQFRETLTKIAFPSFATILVWGGAILFAGFCIKAIWDVISDAASGPPR